MRRSWRLLARCPWCLAHLDVFPVIGSEVVAILVFWEIVKGKYSVICSISLAVTYTTNKKCLEFRDRRKQLRNVRSFTTIFCSPGRNISFSLPGQLTARFVCIRMILHNILCCVGFWRNVFIAFVSVFLVHLMVLPASSREWWVSVLHFYVELKTMCIAEVSGLFRFSNLPRP